MEPWVFMKKGADTKTLAAYVPESRSGTGRASYEPLMMIKLNVIMTAGGNIGAPCIFVTGATTDELDPSKHPSGVAVMKVPDMGRGVGNIGGGGGDGFIFVVGGSSFNESPDGLTPVARAHLNFLEHVVEPLFSDVRGKLGWKRGDPIPPELKAALFNDGAFDQMSAYSHTKADTIFEDMSCVSVKLAASSTRTTQAADMSRMFPGVHREVANIKPESCFVVSQQTQVVIAALKDMDGVNLAGSKVSALANFAAAIPDIFRRTASPGAILQGFIAGGYVHPREHEACDLQAIRNTCETPRTPASLANVEKHWAQLYHEMLTNGRITDASMAAAGIEPDNAAVGGRVRDRDTNVLSHRRVMVTTSAAQKAEREAAVDAVHNQRVQEQALERARVELLLDQSGTAVTRIVAEVEKRRIGGVAARRGQGPAELRHATVDDVLTSKITAPLLKAVIHVRTYTTSKATKA